ncbi:MAG: hypothetical protein PHZ26_00080 [Candidatus Gracilibacteria bacterium]|nr:hypothetical protein [Candidatus Gracilibacteria bacterium]MDD2908134.1 hypothetical protein [Candidatus Gracilibacteria bacterium]
MQNNCNSNIPSGPRIKLNTHFFDNELILKYSKEIEKKFFHRLGKEEKEIVEMILEGQFKGNIDIFLEELKKRGINPKSKLVQLYDKRKTLPKLDFYEDIHESNKDIIPGEKTVGIIDIKGSSSMELSLLSSKIIKMQFLTNLFEDKFKEEGFCVITPSSGDDTIFGILGQNRAYEDLAILRILYTMLKEMGVDFNFFFDKAFIAPEQFLLLIGKNSIHSSNIGGVTEICNTYGKLRKQGNVSRFIGYSFLDEISKESSLGKTTNILPKIFSSKVSRIIKDDKIRKGEIYSDENFDDLMVLGTENTHENKTEIGIRNILEQSELGRRISRILKTNNLLINQFIEYHHARIDIEIIKGGYRNDSVFLINGITTIKPLIGKEKTLTGLQLLGEGSLLQGHKSIANADCSIKKDSIYLKISHSILNCILEGIPLKLDENNTTNLQIDYIDRDYIKNLFKNLNSRRLGENFKKAA